MSPIINRSTLRFQHCRRNQTKPKSHQNLNPLCPKFTTIQICKTMNILPFWKSVNNTSIRPQTIYSTKNNTNQSNNQRKRISGKNSTQREEFTYKVRSLRLGHITQCEYKKPNTKKWHCSCAPSKVFQCFCMCSIIQIPNTLKQCRASNSMSNHCKKSSNNSNFIHCKLCKHHYTHMGHTTISNNFFLINLSKCCLTCINNTNLTNCTYKRGKIRTCSREKIKIKTQKSICS